MPSNQHTCARAKATQSQTNTYHSVSPFEYLLCFARQDRNTHAANRGPCKTTGEKACHCVPEPAAQAVRTASLVAVCLSRPHPFGGCRQLRPDTAQRNPPPPCAGNVCNPCSELRVVHVNRVLVAHRRRARSTRGSPLLCCRRQRSRHCVSRFVTSFQDRCCAQEVFIAGCRVDTITHRHRHGVDTGTMQ